MGLLCGIINGIDDFQHLIKQQELEGVEGVDQIRLEQNKIKVYFVSSLTLSTNSRVSSVHVIESEKQNMKLY